MFPGGAVQGTQSSHLFIPSVALTLKIKQTSTCTSEAHVCFKI